MTYLEPCLRRSPRKKKTDWTVVGLCAAGGAILLAYTILAMVVGGLITRSWEHQTYAFNYPAMWNGKSTTLGAVCVKAAAQGALTGDLLAYCK